MYQESPYTSTPNDDNVFAAGNGDENETRPSGAWLPGNRGGPSTALPAAMRIAPQIRRKATAHQTRITSEHAAGENLNHRELPGVRGRQITPSSGGKRSARGSRLRRVTGTSPLSGGASTRCGWWFVWWWLGWRVRPAGWWFFGLVVGVSVRARCSDLRCGGSWFGTWLGWAWRFKSGRWVGRWVGRGCAGESCGGVRSQFLSSSDVVPACCGCAAGECGSGEPANGGGCTGWGRCGAEFLGRAGCCAGFGGSRGVADAGCDGWGSAATSSGTGTVGRCGHGAGGFRSRPPYRWITWAGDGSCRRPDAGGCGRVRRCGCGRWCGDRVYDNGFGSDVSWARLVTGVTR